MDKYISADNLVLTVLVLWACVTLYNAIMTAVEHHQKRKKQEDDPAVAMRKDIAAHDAVIKDHEKQLETLWEGQEKLLLGVRALLAHGIHNGNSDEMQAASDSIDKWLVKRKND